MRKLLVSAAAIALFTIPFAWAQPGDEHGHGHATEGGGPAPQEHGGPPGGSHVEHGAGPHPQAGPNPAYSRGPNGGQGGGGNSGRPVMTSNPGYSRGPNGGQGGGGNPASGTMTSNPGYSRGPNGGGNFHPQGASNMAGRPGGGFNRPSGDGPRRDFHGFADYHQNFTAPRHFRAGVYHQPAGWYPHHWMFGEFLPATFWARDYWLINFMDFGLPPPPYGAVWVRVGYDALLIDQDTGEVITVEYGVFY